MEQDYIICIQSCIETDGETELVESTEKGTLVQKNGAWYVNYNQSSVMTRVKLSSEGNASILRGGSDSSRMDLIRGETTDCTYQTEYFPISFTVFTEKVQHDLTESGGTIRLHYTLSYGEDTTQKFKLKIQVREAV